MTPLEQAQSLVLDACGPLAPVQLELVEAVGRVLAQRVVAPESVPPFENSAVDGYAVRAVDVAAHPVELVVIDEVPAGTASSATIGVREAIRVMTGAPMPGGADAVVMVERTERLDHGARVNVLESVEPGAGIRAAGSDIAQGATVFEPGVVITPPVAGVLSSVNARTVTVVAAPRVAVLSTGDELVADGSPLGPGQIRESNLLMLDSMLSDAGCDVVNLGVVPDDETELESVLLGAAGSCDAIVSSGGVSMGDFDVVKAVLGRIAHMTWMQVAIKPAKPFAFGVLNGIPVFGLPGNPVSSMVSFEMFARPALRLMAGHSQFHRPRVVAIADTDFVRRPDGRVHLDRVDVTFASDGRVHARSVGAQGSHQLAASATATGLAVVPDGDTVRAGEELTVLLLGRS